MPRPCSPLLLGVATGLAVSLAVPVPVAHARNLMSADGPGGTYELLQRAYTTELPDCGHMVPHITEEMDSELGKYVFVFHAHVNQDDDRCGGTDRQRTEIRARAADIVASNGETVHYRWKFKLAAGFQGTSRFTHIFQIKSDLGAPIMTLTPRVSTFGITGRVGGSPTTDLAKLVGVWVVVDLKVLYSNSGRVDLTIRRVSDGAMLYAHSGAADMWDDNASGHDSKFGIYRSLGERGRMRDEQVRFADFCASKVSASECDDGAAPPTDAGAPGPGPSDAGAAPDTPADSGGSGGSGGSSGTGGSAGAGNPGSGGASGTGGTTGAGGTTTQPPGSSPRPDAGGRPPSSPSDPSEGGCNCSLQAAAGGHGGSAAVAILLGFALALRRKRRGHRC